MYITCFSNFEYSLLSLAVEEPCPAWGVPGKLLWFWTGYILEDIIGGPIDDELVFNMAAQQSAIDGIHRVKK